jgi:hypothetical protein
MCYEKIYLLILILSINLSVNAQTADQPIRLHNISNLNDLNNITSPATGSLAFVQNNMYYYDETKWNTFWTTYSNNNTNSTNTLGTTNNEDLRVMTNNIQRINLTEFGSVFINYQEDNNLEFAVGNPSN